MKRIARSKVAAAGIIVIVCLAVYGGTLANGFVHDDHDQIINNQWITHVRYLPSILFASVWSFQEDPQTLSNYYRPVMYIIYMAEYHLFNLNPWGWHLVNILLHSANSIMAFLIFCRLSILPSLPGSKGHGDDALPAMVFPLLATLLFATHPVNSEAVAWVACVPELSFTLFYLLAFYLYLKSRDEGKQTVSEDKDTTFSAYSLLSVFSFFLATLSKETALTFPLLLLIYDYCSENYRVRHLLKYYKRYALYGVAIAVYFTTRFYAMGGVVPREPMHQHLTSFQTFINIFPILLDYFKFLLFPINLSHFHAFNPLYTFFSANILLSILFTQSLLAAALYCIKTRRIAALHLFFLALIVIPLLPALYIPALGKNIFAERYLYLPSVGFIGILFLLFQRVRNILSNSRGISWIAIALLLTVVGTYSYGTVQRSGVWKDDFTLWESVIAEDPENYFAIYKLGNLYLNNHRPDEAITTLRRALEANSSRTHPDLGNAAYSFLNMGEAYKQKGLLDEAIIQYKKVLRLAPDFPIANYDIGIAYQQKGLLDNAIAHYQHALKFFNKTSDISLIKSSYNNIGACFALKGLWNMAIENYEHVLNIDPKDPVALRNRAIAKASVLKGNP
jgi:tetratricopeptide (TPR) repeat protein